MQFLLPIRPFYPQVTTLFITERPFLLPAWLLTLPKERLAPSPKICGCFPAQEKN